MLTKKAPNPTDKHVGSRVRMRRMMLGMSQEKLGDALDLTFQQVQKYEKGTNRIGASRLQQIAHILQVPVSFFFEGGPSTGSGRADGMGEAPSPAYVSEFLVDIGWLGAHQSLHAHRRRKAAAAHCRSRRANRRPRKALRNLAPPAARRVPRRPTCRPHLDRAGVRCNNHLFLRRPKTLPGLPCKTIASGRVTSGSYEGSVSLCHVPTTCSRASRFRRGIRTRSPTRSPTPFSMLSSNATSSSASPTTAWSIPGWAAKRFARPTRSSLPAKAAANCSARSAGPRLSIAS